jgi:hypothetical protein
MQVEAMRAALHEAIDQIIEGYLDDGAAEPSAREADPGGDGIRVVAGEDHRSFTYRWPSGGDEEFTRSRWYIVSDRGREHRVLVAWTEREAWGRMRERAVVFGEAGSSLYPWTEFVETDDGRYAAGISDPAHPRALLRHGGAIPGRFDPATIERTDQLFNGIRQGPSLRLVVKPDDEVPMVRHGYWVAGLRNRL